MAQVRLGAQQYIHRYVFDDPDTQRRIIRDAQRSIREQLGRELVDQLVVKEHPTVVRIVEKWMDNYEVYTIALPDVILQIYADLVDVEVMQVRTMELPPFEFSYRVSPQHPLIIEWQCGYCGQTNLVEKHLECRKCGAPRKPLR